MNRIEELRNQIDMMKAMMANCYSDEAYRIQDARLSALIRELVELEKKEPNK